MTEKRNDGGGQGARKSAEVRKFAAAGRNRKCPGCGKPADIGYRPFCSKRCAELDLGRWFREDYRIATQEQPEGGEETDADADTDSEQDPRSDPS